MTHNTREWEAEFDEQFKGAIQLKSKPDGVTVTRLKAFIHQELQKARAEQNTVLLAYQMSLEAGNVAEVLTDIKNRIKVYQSNLDQPKQ